MERARKLMSGPASSEWLVRVLKRNGLRCQVEAIADIQSRHGSCEYPMRVAPVREIFGQVVAGLRRSGSSEL
jgi:hypothetical protein